MENEKKRMGDERLLAGNDYLTIRSEETNVAITDDYIFGYMMRQLGVCTSVIKDVIAFLDAGGNACMYKPSRLNQLLSRVQLR